MRYRALLAFTWMTVAGCASPAGDAASEPGAGGKADDGQGSASVLPRCVGRAFTAPARVEWRHWSSDLDAATGDPRHVAQDAIARPGRAVELAVKVAYGAVWNDLEDEDVAVYVDDCTRWRSIATVRTDEDGRAVVRLPADLAIGAHEVRFVVLGDGTQARATAWLLPTGTHVVVSDIDGTLTTSDGELYQQILDGDHVPAAYDGAVELTETHADLGHVVVYLTGRPYWLLDNTRAWLAGQGFAAGPLHVADSNTEILPLDSSVGAYKHAWLDQLAASGFVIDLAYGNATTDIHAYAAAGIPPASTWIIGPHAGEEGTHAVRDSWWDRVAEVAAGAPIDQPF